MSFLRHGQIYQSDVLFSTAIDTSDEGEAKLKVGSRRARQTRRPSSDSLGHGTAGVPLNLNLPSGNTPVGGLSNSAWNVKMNGIDDHFGLRKNPSIVLQRRPCRENTPLAQKGSRSQQIAGSPGSRPIAIRSRAELIRSYTPSGG
jgi:hypothetical protein